MNPFTHNKFVQFLKKWNVDIEWDFPKYHSSPFLSSMENDKEVFNIHIDLIDLVGNTVILITDPAWKIPRPNKTFNQIMVTTLR